MKPIVISKSQARKIILHAAGLWKAAPFGKGPEAVYKLINHLGFVQLDTNYVMERAHHHAIATRVPGYKPEWLEELQEDGRVFEYFTSDAGYLPMQDFRFSFPVKESFKNRKPQTAGEINLMEKVLDRVAREGPLMVKDFDNDRVEASSGWWDWRPSKVALERLYLSGRLMITRKKDFRKIYDLPMNMLPAGVDQTPVSSAAFERFIIRRSLQSLGIAYAKEIGWRARYVKKNTIKKELEKMVDAGEVCAVSIDGVKAAPLYMLPTYKNKKIELSGNTFILSPFDILNVFRHRLRDFFDFDYQVECFVPAPKRKYGYFSLPVLMGDRFVARMDSKADRKQAILTIHNLHFEPVKLSSKDLAAIIDAVKTFARFNECRSIELKKTNNKQYLKIIRKGLL